MGSHVAVASQYRLDCKTDFPYPPPVMDYLQQNHHGKGLGMDMMHSLGLYSAELRIAGSGLDRPTRKTQQLGRTSEVAGHNFGMMSRARQCRVGSD
jgi:hypothetical protein